MQLGLDAAGFIPGFGAIPDLISAGISLARGNTGDALFSLLAAVPLVGDAIAAPKLAYKGVKFVSKTTRVVSRTVDARQEAKVLAKAESKVDDALHGFACPKCFVAGTKILTEDGEKNIEDIKVGDKVLSKNELTGEQEYKEVLNLFERIADEGTITISVGKEKIETTETHPFWVQNKGWVEAGSLVKGDVLTTFDGQLLPIYAIIVNKQPKKVYNFEVADFHTYFVSSTGVWVHNKSKNCGPHFETTYTLKPSWITILSTHFPNTDLLPRLKENIQDKNETTRMFASQSLKNINTMVLLFNNINIGEITLEKLETFECSGTFRPNKNFELIKDFLYKLTDEDFTLNETNANEELLDEERWFIQNEGELIKITVPAIYENGEIYFRYR